MHELHIGIVHVLLHVRPTRMDLHTNTPTMYMQAMLMQKYQSLKQCYYSKHVDSTLGEAIEARDGSESANTVVLLRLPLTWEQQKNQPCA